MAQITPSTSSYMNGTQAQYTASLSKSGGAQLIVSTWFSPQYAHSNGYYLPVGTLQYPVVCNPVTSVTRNCSTEEINRAYGTAPFPPDNSNTNNNDKTLLIIISIAVGAVVLVIFLAYMWHRHRNASKDTLQPAIAASGGNYPFMQIND